MGNVKNTRKTATRMIKILYCIMAFVIFFSQLSPGNITAKAAGFNDIPAGAWYETYVNDLVGKKIISGTGNGKYSPNSTLSRAEAVAIMTKICLSEADIAQYKGFTRFPYDVPTGEWFTPYVNWASEAGIVNGYGGGAFSPYKAVTRQELAVIISRFSTRMGYKLPANTAFKQFSDQRRIGSWAAPSVKFSQTSGVFSGDEYNNFNPTANTRRSEAAAVFYRFLNNADTSQYSIVRKRIAGKYVEAVTFDSAKYTAGVEMASGGVNGGEGMGSMLSRTGAKFAINAGFFDMSSYVPYATIITAGRPVTIFDQYAPYKPSFTVDGSGRPYIKNFTLNQILTLNRTDGHTSTLSYVNRNRRPSSPSDPTRIVFDRRWGKSVGLKAKDAIVVDSNGKITHVLRDANDVAIPEYGYVLFQSARRQYEGDFFDSCRVGDSIGMKSEYPGSGLSIIASSISAGPLIVRNGAVYGNTSTYHQEGLFASDITTNVAKRVAIGVNGSKVTMATVNSANMAQLSDIMLSLGCYDAMNLDGGGSSGLYVDGQYMSTPSRNLNNMIYFK